MTNQHPIIPPPELVQQWTSLSNEMEGNEVWMQMAIFAAQWGADQELRAVCKWVRSHHHSDTWPSRIRADRRPKPPSLKEQALVALNKGCFPSDDEIAAIRRALEQLPDD